MKNINTTKKEFEELWNCGKCKKPKSNTPQHLNRRTVGSEGVATVEKPQKKKEFVLHSPSEVLKKGCGKKFLWISSLKDYRICGRMEDLKHSEHIIYCDNCKMKISSYEAGFKEAIKKVGELVFYSTPLNKYTKFMEFKKEKLKELK